MILLESQRTMNSAVPPAGPMASGCGDVYRLAHRTPDAKWMTAFSREEFRNSGFTAADSSSKGVSPGALRGQRGHFFAGPPRFLPRTGGKIPDCCTFVTDFALKWGLRIIPIYDRTFTMTHADSFPNGISRQRRPRSQRCCQRPGVLSDRADFFAL
jgi:hypothetical protein